MGSPTIDRLAAKLEIPPDHPSDRALWHLELGYQPGDEYVGDDAPLAYCIFPTADDFDDDDPTDDLCPECLQGPYDCQCHVGAECGRWRNGSLSRSCMKAGSEECDFECPYRASLF